ncbi:hypothetical protein BC833DRAFT_617027 [Globomyces pollinis-pini]|nr:hypothetical protein BC833DRAFT_617027 [Globomyces pollinis-pini]
MEESETVTKRLYIGGINFSTTSADISERFKKFGEVSNIEFPKPKNDKSTFMYLTIKSSTSQLKKCISVYHGTKWRGNVLSIQEAKPHFQNRLQREQESAVPEPTFKPRQLTKKKLKRKPNQHSENMSVVPLCSNSKKNGWVKGRYNRLLPKVNVRNPRTGRQILIDPVKYQYHFKKLEDEDIPVSVMDLHFTNDDSCIMDLSKDAIRQTSDTQRKRAGNWTDEEIQQAIAHRNYILNLEKEKEQIMKSSGLSKKQFLLQEHTKAVLESEYKSNLKLAENFSKKLGNDVKSTGTVDFLSDDEEVKEDIEKSNIALFDSSDDEVTTDIPVSSALASKLDLFDDSDEDMPIVNSIPVRSNPSVSDNLTIENE